jgi:DNA-binding Lrp family transcriptional regulator
MMARKGRNHTLDALDLRLIAELETDPRRSYIDLATALGVNGITVQRRLRRLLDERIVSLVTLLQTSALGYDIAMLGLNVSPGQSDRVAENLARRPLVGYVIITSGRYDIMAWVNYKDTTDLFDFVTGDLVEIAEITSAEAMPVLKTMKYSWALLGNADFRKVPVGLSRDLDADDWSLLAALSDNPRVTSTHVAKLLGVSRPTAGTRLQQLIDEDVARVICMANRDALGYTLPLGIMLRIQPDRILEVAEKLVSNQFIHHVVATSGRCDLIAWATFKYSGEMSDFLKNWLGSIPGIRSTETILSLKTVSGPLSVRSVMSHLQNQKG